MPCPYRRICMIMKVKWDYKIFCQLKPYLLLRHSIALSQKRILFKGRCCNTSLFLITLKRKLLQAARNTETLKRKLLQLARNTETLKRKLLQSARNTETSKRKLLQSARNTETSKRKLLQSARNTETSKRKLLQGKRKLLLLR